MQMTNAAGATDMIGHSTEVPSMMDIPACETTAAPCWVMATMALHAAGYVATCIGMIGLCWQWPGTGTQYLIERISHSPQGIPVIHLTMQWRESGHCAVERSAIDM